MDYLKKKKMYAVVLELGYPVPVLRDCNYKYYRGSEWLAFPLDDNEYLELYHFNGYFSVTILEYDEFDKCKQKFRSFYNGERYKDLISKVS